MIYLLVHNSCHNHWFVNHLHGLNKTVRKSYMLQTTLCKYLKEALSFSSVIDFSSEKYIIFTRHRYSWYQKVEIRWGPRGTQSFDISSKTSILPQMCCQVSAKRPKSIEKGYIFLIMDIRFWKNFWRLFLLITFSSAVTQNYHAFKIFYIYPKIPNSAKTYDHKIWDGCPWNVYWVTSLGREDAAKQLTSSQSRCSYSNFYLKLFNFFLQRA